MDGSKNEESNTSDKSKEEIQSERKARKAEKAAKKSGPNTATSKNFQRSNPFYKLTSFVDFLQMYQRNPNRKTSNLRFKIHQQTETLIRKLNPCLKVINIHISICAYSIDLRYTFLCVEKVKNETVTAKPKKENAAEKIKSNVQPDLTTNSSKTEGN